MHTHGRLYTPTPHASARLASAVGIRAAMTEATGLHKYLRVSPEVQPPLVWLHPGGVLEYQVESNTRWQLT